MLQTVCLTRTSVGTRARLDQRPSLSSRTFIRKRSLGVTGLQARFKFSDSLQGFFSQCASFTSDFDLSNALDVWHATVKRGDELVQMTELARSIRLSTPLYYWTSPVLLISYEHVRSRAGLHESSTLR
jgi:hypothetical protein